ncbi:MAG TPA: helix-turn-helix domain-containing protein [Anaerolineae bacterium]|nr:helix-turn-helix domain-containing protein [Anaerolineae bacterium]
MATSPTEIINPGEFNPNDWITSKEAEELTGYARTAILSAAKRGTLKFIKRGNMLFYLRKDILEYADRMKALGTQKHTPKIYRNQAPQKTA